MQDVVRLLQAMPAKPLDTEIALRGMQIVALGSDKAELPASKTFILSLLAGVYISFGGMLAISVGGACTGLAQVGTCTWIGRLHASGLIPAQNHPLHLWAQVSLRSATTPTAMCILLHNP